MQRKLIYLKWISAFLSGCVLLTGLSATALASENALTEIQVSKLTGDKVQLTLETTAPLSNPLSFSIDSPARIALDLPDTTNRLPERSQKIGIGLAESVTAVEAKGRTRVVINLAEMVPYTTRVEDNKVIVTLNDTVPVTASNTNTTSTANPSNVSLPNPTVTEGITNIDFRRGEAGQGRIIITLSNPKTVVDVDDSGRQTILTVKNALANKRYIRRLDVLDFATPAQYIDTRIKGNDTTLTISTVGDYEKIAYQSGNIFTFELRPLTAAEVEEKQLLEPVYKGERITLNFQDVETRKILQILADVSGFNLVVSDNVSGNITLRLQNVPWDQALDIVLKSEGLSMRDMGDVVMIGQTSEIAAQEKVELEARKQIETLAPLRFDFIQVNYAKATDMAALIQTEGSSFSSGRGSISIDDRTNTLLVYDTSDKISEIRALVNRLDIPVRQVLIEARIVIANDDFTKELGVQVGFTGVKASGSDLLVTTGNSFGTNTMINSALAAGTPGAPATGLFAPFLTDRLNVNLPSPGASGNIAFAILGSDYLIDLELSALQAEGRGEVISSPRVITANQKKASIRQGVEIPYQEASSSGATTISFKEAVLSLEVTPLITPDNRIAMELLINKDSVGELVPAGQGFIPSIDTREIETEVLVENGETVVLGGIYERASTESMSKVPLLGEIPFIGRLFRSERTVNDKAELLIFVTPKILTEGGLATQ